MVECSGIDPVNDKDVLVIGFKPALEGGSIGIGSNFEIAVLENIALIEALIDRVALWVAHHRRVPASGRVNCDPEGLDKARAFPLGTFC